jgi:hypothetical protein
MSNSSSIISAGGKSEWPKILGQAIFYSSIQAAIGSVEMSSKFSVMNFAKDDQTLLGAASALNQYMIIGIAWMIGTCLVLYSQYGMKGIIAGIICNMIYIGWIWFSYKKTLHDAAIKYGITEPPYFF